MIYNRTQADVKNAIEIRKNKISQGAELTAEELAIVERGFVTVNTLNRIEEKQSEIETTLKDMGYYNCDITTKQWNKSGLFDELDLQRMFENNSILRKAFFVFESSPLDAVPLYDYKNFNDLERILSDLAQMIDFTKQNYQECGTFECG
jgi:hypothetical protein